MPVQRWSGREARALRVALRLSVRAFAAHLGIAARTVSKWEAGGEAVQPRPDTQAMLDTALIRADGAAQQRFEMLCRSGPAAVAPLRRQQWEYESWVDDLDRASVALSRQDFVQAGTLIERWLTRFTPDDLDDRGHYLLARSLVVQGGIRRDQGRLSGPGSARASYQAARAGFEQLGIPVRVAQAELNLAVLAEMDGALLASAAAYDEFARDERLSNRDRGLALLWVGTALSKIGPGKARRAEAVSRAIDCMSSASIAFERLDEAADWGVAQQKLALAHRASGDLDTAMAYIDSATRSRISDSPLQHVRLTTARAHVLLSDPATRSEGLQIIAGARETAMVHGLRHQLDAITAITAAAHT